MSAARRAAQVQQRYRAFGFRGVCVIAPPVRGAWQSQLENGTVLMRSGRFSVLLAARFPTRWPSSAQSAVATFQECGAKSCKVGLHASLRAVPRGVRGCALPGAQPPPR